MENKISALKAHISLNVKDVSKSIEFYQKLFAIAPAKVRQGYAKFDVQNPPLNLALNESSGNGHGSLSHLGIQVASTADVLATKNRWAESGLVTKDEMQTDCCYALQDKTWVSDPDGNNWEVFVVLEDNLLETNVRCVSAEPKIVSERQSGEFNSRFSSSGSLESSVSRETNQSCC